MKNAIYIAASVILTIFFSMTMSLGFGFLQMGDIENGLLFLFAGGTPLVLSGVFFDNVHFYIPKRDRIW